MGERVCDCLGVEPSRVQAATSAPECRRVEVEVQGRRGPAQLARQARNVAVLQTQLGFTNQMDRMNAVVKPPHPRCLCYWRHYGIRPLQLNQRLQSLQSRLPQVLPPECVRCQKAPS